MRSPSRTQTRTHTPEARIWCVTRSHHNEIQDRETFQTFADAWAYAQPDPENGIYHYINKTTVQNHFTTNPTTPLTTAYEGNVRIQMSLRRSSRAVPHRPVQFVT